MNNKDNKVNDDKVYLDTYVLQQDMRIRLPKSILNNLPVEKGNTKFAIYLNKATNEIILQITEEGMEAKNE
ncbi:MAG TPA: sucrose-6-phosphate hydrolase [Gallicola sp.]|nr:sucrose-6-phosphate hydrolase [Gallicola sp.]